MSWTPQNFEDSIRRQEVYPFYYLYGEETYLVEDALTRLEKLALGEGLRDFNLTKYYGDEADGDAVREAIETLPMMAQVRVVILREAQDMSDKKWEQILPVLETPVDSCVFICVATKIDKRKKYAKRFLESGVTVEFKRPYDNQIPDWIRTIASRHSMQLEPDAVEVMHQLVGGNLSDINAEMLKLSQYLGIRKTATENDVLKSVSRIRVQSVFELTDAIASQDRERALVNLSNLLEHGQNEVGVLSLISRHVRILQLVNTGLSEGLSGARLSTRAGVSQFFLKQYVEQSRYWNDKKIERTFGLLLDTDRALKSSAISNSIWLEKLIVDTCA